MRPLVSVIVPVYKVEDVLARCLDSLCRQSLNEIEIILVDDASPDRCGEICDEYAEKDSRFQVIHHPEHRGVAAARNTGLAHAAADYLMFADGDDWVLEDFCRLPYEYALQHGADLVIFGYHVDKPGLQKTIRGKQISKLTKLETIDSLLINEAVVNYAVWNKLYKKTLFHAVSFPEGYTYEDVVVTCKTILLADSIYYLDKELYCYCYCNGSITTLRTEKAFKDWYAMFMQQYHDLAAWGYPEDKLERLLQNIALTYCIRRKADRQDDNYVFCFKTIQATHHIPENFAWKRKILFVLLKYYPPVFDLVCNLWGKRWHFSE